MLFDNRTHLWTVISLAAVGGVYPGVARTNKNSASKNGTICKENGIMARIM